MNSSRNNLQSNNLSSRAVAGSELHSSSMPSSKADFKNPQEQTGSEPGKQNTVNGAFITNSRTVSHQELASHKETGDVWTSINGKVYEIADYVKRHPGGVQNIMKGAGKDATYLFNSVHPWIKYDVILSGKFIGYLESFDLCEDVDPFESYFQQDHTLSLASIFPLCFAPQKRFAAPKTNFRQDQNNLFLSVKMINVALDNYFDENNWAVSLLEGIGFHVLVLKVFLSSANVWLLHLKLIDVLSDPDMDLFFLNPRKVQIKMHKPSLGKWKTLGEPLKNHNTVIQNYLTPPNMHFATIIQKEFLTPNVCHFVFEMSKSAFVGVPLGFDIKLELELEQGSITRQYTPVSTLTDFHHPTNRIVEWTIERKQLIRCFIKIYPNGKLTSMLVNVPVGIPDSVKIGSCAGFFNPQWLDGVKFLILAPAGSGITPMVNIVKHFIARDEEETEILFVFTNMTEKDIVLKSMWKKVDESYNWFHFAPIVTDPSPAWKGFSGRPTTQIFKDVLSKCCTKKFNLRNMSSKCAICGPPGYVTTMNKILGELEMSNEQIFNFL